MPASFTGSPVGCVNGGYPVRNHITGNAGTADGTVCVTAAPTITVVKTPRSTTAGPGDNVVYDVVATNSGTAPGSTTFTDNIDDSASIVTLPSNCTDTTVAGDKKFTCTTGTINPGGTETVTYTIKMPSTFTGTPSGCDNGGYPVVNRVVTLDSSRSSATVCVNATPNLALVKTGSLAFDDNGDQIISYTISYTNTGAAQANAVTITDAIPAGTVFSSCSNSCTTSGNPATATWAIAPINPLTGSGSVQLQVKVTTNQTCSISNTAQIRLGGVVAATSNAAVVNVTPVPDPTTAKSNGNAIGVQIKAKGLAQLVVGLLNVVVTGSGNSQVITVGQTSSSQTGPGGPVANEAHLLNLSLTGILSTGIIRETSSSVVTAAPAETRQTSTSEVADICLVPVAGVCTVKSDTARAVASTSANGAYASASAAGSTIENLFVAGVAVPVDLSQTTKIPLNAVLFGANSYVAINERTSTSGLSNGRYVADMTVSMIHVKITNLALVGALDVVVAQATAHSDFPKTLVCSGSNNQAVSGHAFAAKLYTGPLLADLTQGFVGISPLGGAESQHIAGVVVPSTGVAVNAQAADTSSAGSFTPTGSTSWSWAEVAGDGTKPACVLSYVTNCVVKATLIRSEARSTATAAGSISTDTGTSLVGLSVLGIPIDANAAPNSTLVLPGIGFIILNEQTCDNGAAASHTCTGSNHSGITVRAVRIVITVANNILHLNPGVELTVAEAHADTTFGLS
ncbi:MAG: choice-of-anchor P family protein [Marmoricola sp.]